ncbi:uncharacterized protein LOC144457974 [Phascolarctos cinereus]
MQKHEHRLHNYMCACIHQHSFPPTNLEVLTLNSPHPAQAGEEEEVEGNSEPQPASPPVAPVSADSPEGEAPDGTGASVENKADSPSNRRRPSLSEVILWAVAGSKTRRGVSLATLKKAVSSTGFNMARNAQRFKRVLKGLVAKGVLKQVTGTGVSGSFRMGKKKLKCKKAAQPQRQKRQRKQPHQEEQQKVKGRQKKGSRKPARRSRK